jgi:hypothetical protein
MKMNIEESTEYLKKVGEWDMVFRLERDLIIKWANFLKEREEKQKKESKKKETKELV